MTKHSLRRTSPKGEAFIGTCVLCGRENLPVTAVKEDCPNVRGLTEDQAVVEAVKGDDQ